jgi:hypothetical protein
MLPEFSNDDAILDARVPAVNVKLFASVTVDTVYKPERVNPPNVVGTVTENVLPTDCP